MSHADRLIAALAGVFPDGETEVDQDLIERMLGLLGPLAANHVEVLMTGSAAAT